MRIDDHLPGAEQDPDQELRDLLDQIVEGPPVRRSPGRTRRSRSKVAAINDGYLWSLVRPGTMIGPRRLNADDPWLRWGWIGDIREGRFNVSAVRWIQEILGEKGWELGDKVGVRFYRGNGREKGSFAVVPAAYDALQAHEMIALNQRAGKGYYWFHCGGTIGAMQALGFSYLERQGEALIGTLGDFAGYTSMAKSLMRE